MVQRREESKGTPQHFLQWALVVLRYGTVVVVKLDDCVDVLVVVGECVVDVDIVAANIDCVVVEVVVGMVFTVVVVVVAVVDVVVAVSHSHSCVISQDECGTSD